LKYKIQKYKYGSFSREKSQKFNHLSVQKKLKHILQACFFQVFLTRKNWKICVHKILTNHILCWSLTISKSISESTVAEFIEIEFPIHTILIPGIHLIYLIYLIYLIVFWVYFFLLFKDIFCFKKYHQISVYLEESIFA